jgi:tetratricopeptide (TPR) repeat protein
MEQITTAAPSQPQTPGAIPSQEQENPFPPAKVHVARWIVLAILLICLGVAGYVYGRHLYGYYYFSRARKELNKQNWEEARAQFDNGFEACPDDVDARIDCARACRMRHDFNAAENHLDKCKAADDPQKERLKLAWLLLKAQHRDFLALVDDLTSRLQDEKNPDREAILEVVIYGYTANERLQEVVLAANELLKIRPNHLNGLIWEGQTFARTKGRSGDAVKCFQQAFDSHPDCNEARELLATALLSEKLISEARDHYLALVKKQPDNLNARFGLARCYIADGHFDDALPLLDDLLRAKPRDADLIVERALAQYRIAPSSPEAESWLRRAHRVSSRDLMVMKNLVQCLHNNDKTGPLAFTAAAAGGGGVIFTAVGASSEAHEVEAEMINYIDRVNDLARRSRELNAEKATLEDRYEIARLTLELYENSDGVQLMTDILKKYPDYAPAHLALADFYEKRGEINNAKAHRDRAKHP